MTDNLFLEILDSLHEGKTVMLGEAACAMVGEYITNLENDIADLELLQGDCNVKDACIAALEADNARLQQDCLDADRLMTDAMSARDQALASNAKLRAACEKSREFLRKLSIDWIDGECKVTVDYYLWAELEKELPAALKEVPDHE